jgi:hypothetical protein
MKARLQKREYKTLSSTELVLLSLQPSFDKDRKRLLKPSRLLGKTNASQK